MGTNAKSHRGSRHPAGRITYSACSAVVLLAAAGLLKSKTATSHWGYADLFRSTTMLPTSTSGSTRSTSLLRRRPERGRPTSRCRPWKGSAGPVRACRGAEAGGGHI
jgi:hypothetical protein